MSHELRIRLAELTRGELGWLVDELLRRSPGLVRRSVAALDELSPEDRMPIDFIDAMQRGSAD